MKGAFPACSWLEALLDARLQRGGTPDAAAPLDPLLASLQGDSAKSEVLREGLAVGQGKWPPDRCGNYDLLDLFTCIWVMPKTDLTHTPLMVIPEYCSLDSFDLLVNSPGEARLTSHVHAQCFLTMHRPSTSHPAQAAEESARQPGRPAGPGLPKLRSAGQQGAA